jgi:hypothetical protein
MESAEQALDYLRRTRETIMEFNPGQMKLFHGVFDLIADLQNRVTALERPRRPPSKNLLDANGYIEAVLRRVLDSPSGIALADEIIDRLRGGGQ